jgi:hypothetical protein
MEAQADPTMDQADRRASRRARTLKGGRIILNGGYSVFACTVRNMSETGALLQLGETTGIPTHFDLEVEPGRPTRKCTVRWRSQTAVGVSFDDAQ